MMMAAAMRRMSTFASTLPHEDPNRAKWYVFWATEQARKLVVEVLKEEPIKKYGVRGPLVYKKIMERFPDVKLPDHLIPPAADDLMRRPGQHSWVDTHPPNPGHPVRSCHYLKSVVLAEMESKGQIEKIHVVRGKEYDENGTRLDVVRATKRRVVEYMPTDVEAPDEYRFRLVPDAELTPFPEPNPGEMFAVREAAAQKKHAARLYGGMPREVIYTRLGSRDGEPHTRTTRQPGRQIPGADASDFSRTPSQALRSNGTYQEPPHTQRTPPPGRQVSGLRSPISGTLSQAPRSNVTYQRSPTGQRRHYTSAREMWPQTETFLGQSESSSYKKTGSRRAPAKLVTCSAETNRSNTPSLGSLATRSTLKPKMAPSVPQDELVFFHKKPIQAASEESLPPKKYVKPTMSAQLQNQDKWDPLGILRAKREGLYSQWAQEEREAMNAERATKMNRKAVKMWIAKHASPSDELHVFRTAQCAEPPHKALPSSQVQPTTTVDKYAEPSDYARSTAPRRPGAKDMAMENLTQWQQALQEMEANLTELKQKIQSFERDTPRLDKPPTPLHMDSALVQTTPAEDIDTPPFARSATPRAPNVKSASQDLSMDEVKEWDKMIRLQVEEARRQEIKAQAIREEKARKTSETKRRARVPPGSSSSVSTLGSRLTQIDTPLPSRSEDLSMDEVKEWDEMIRFQVEEARRQEEIESQSIEEQRIPERLTMIKEQAIREEKARQAPNVKSASQDLSLDGVKEWDEMIRWQVEEARRQEEIKAQSIEEQMSPERLTMIKEQAIREEKARKTKRRALVPPGSSSFVSTLGSRLIQIATPLPSRGFQDLSEKEWDEMFRLQVEEARRQEIKEQAIREEKARKTKRRALVPPGSSSFVSTLGSRLTQIDTPLPSRSKGPYRPKTFVDTERAVLE